MVRYGLFTCDWVSESISAAVGGGLSGSRLLYKQHKLQLYSLLLEASKANIR